MDHRKMASALLFGPALLLLPLTSSCAAERSTSPPKAINIPATPTKFSRVLHVAASPTVNGDGSEQKPFSSIAAALEKAKPGEGILVRGGTYREQLKLPSGTEAAPITLMAEPGQRVILSGFAPIEGWKPFRDEIQVATLNSKPDGLFIHQTLQPMAQEPNEGWYNLKTVRAGEPMLLSDPDRLANYPRDLTGGHVMVHQTAGNLILSGPVTALDKVAGTVTVGKSKLKPQAGDRYLLKNNVSLIDRPGEWAFEKAGDARFRIYFWPQQPEDLRAAQTRRAENALISGSGTSYVRVEGLEITGSQTDGVFIGKGSSQVILSRCIVTNNGNVGVRVRNSSDCAVTRCLILNNGNGVGVSSARNILVENNEVAFNEIDGIIVAGDTSGQYGKPGANPADTTSNVVVRRNYVHHHMLSGHPDNFQMFRGVQDVQLIENLSIGGGQGLMTEEVDRGELRGNVFVSSAANMIIFGHDNSNDWKLYGNTFALPGYSITSMTGRNYEARENVFVGPFTNLSSTYQGNHNVFTVVPRGAKFEKFQSLSDIQRATGQELNSLHADAAPLRNVPRSHAIAEQITLATRDTLYLRGAEDFKPGDIIEVNWDGVPRSLTKVESATGQKRGKTVEYTKVSFTPALPSLPVRITMVANWGERKNLQLDTRLTTGDPAAKAAPDGGALGASIDIAAYQRGDFDGDGKRDLPEIPEDVKAGLPNPNALLTPMF